MKGPCLEPADRRPTPLIRCYHSGDLGDIIYSLGFCRSLGTVSYAIGPDPAVQVREAMTTGKFQWLRPLLQRQPWIEEALFAPRPPNPLHYNLNEFRWSWFAPKNAHRRDRSLYQAYPEHFGKPPLPESEPWLVADPAPDTAHPVIVSRTARWRNPAFPWKQIVDRYRGKIAFVGLDSEWAEFERTWGTGVGVYRPINDALDLANVILGARLFIGNQSFPMALALGLGVPLIQEACPGQHDCILARDNSQFVTGNSVKLPDLGTQPMRPVTVTSTRKDKKIELGPFVGAPGIGDTLMVTPLARALGERALMFLPPAMSRLAFLFRGICPVTIVENPPYFTFQVNKLQSAGLLGLFGLGHVDPIPSINQDQALLQKARTMLAHYQNPIAFCPTCSRHWANQRQRPWTFWRDIIRQLAQRYTVLQFGLPDYPTIDKAVRMPFVSLEELAALYHEIGIYIGVHTGDHHLMLACGGRAVVAEADPWNEGPCWTYDAPARIRYGKLSNPKTVQDAIASFRL